nr:hypothetical protein [Kitasatospora sp. MBT66]
MATVLGRVEGDPLDLLVGEPAAVEGDADLPRPRRLGRGEGEQQETGRVVQRGGDEADLLAGLPQRALPRVLARVEEPTGVLVLARVVNEVSSSG